MARKLRVEYPGAIYHVMNRGDRREPIFKDDADRQRFVETLGEACAKTGWQVHAYVLMPNHFHLVVETPQPNLVAGMKWLLGTYTSRFNRRHERVGPIIGNADLHATKIKVKFQPWLASCESNQAHDQAQAERMLSLWLRRLRLNARQLAGSSKGQAEKQVLAWWLYGRTTVTRRWLAEQLQMGYETRVSQAVRWVESSRAHEVLEVKKRLEGCAL